MVGQWRKFFDKKSRFWSFFAKKVLPKSPKTIILENFFGKKLPKPWFFVKKFPPLTDHKLKCSRFLLKKTLLHLRICAVDFLKKKNLLHLRICAVDFFFKPTALKDLCTTALKDLRSRLKKKILLHLRICAIDCSKKNPTAFKDLRRRFFRKKSYCT